MQTRPFRHGEGVFLWSGLDIESYYGAAMARVMPGHPIRQPEQISDPEQVTFALAWDPAPDAFERFPNLRLILSIGAGVNHIMACPGLPAGVPVVRVVDEDQARDVTGFAIWHVLWHHRRFGSYLTNQKHHRWERQQKRPTSTLRIGVLGYGHIGRRIALGLRQIGYQVSALCRDANNRGDAGIRLLSGPGALEKIAAESDILVNILPLTPETTGILSAEIFDRMPLGSALVQLGRGEHLVEADLLAALDSGHLSGASLDVFTTEPLPGDHPLWDHPGILVTPHEASEVHPERFAQLAAQTLAQQERGEGPLSGVVATDRGY